MRLIVRRDLVSFIALFAALVLFLVAVADHTNKQRRMDRAELAEWYCTHHLGRCGGASSAKIEEHWNQRETAYVIGAVAALAFALVRAAAIRRSSS